MFKALTISIITSIIALGFYHHWQQGIADQWLEKAKVEVAQTAQHVAQALQPEQ